MDNLENQQDFVNETNQELRTNPNNSLQVKKKKYYKKWWFWLIAFFALCIICGLLDDDSSSVTVETKDETKIIEKIEKQDVRIISTKIIEASERYEPDILNITIKNDTDKDIKNAVVAFVGWDKNNLPVKIIHEYDYDGGAYVSECSFEEINLIPGATYGQDGSGFPLNDDCIVNSFKAIVVSYETFDGETWSNPCYDSWISIYSGKKLTDSNQASKTDKSSTKKSDDLNSVENEIKTTKKALSKAELEAELAKQELKIVSQKYIVQDNRWKSLYPDLLSVVLKNDTKYDIKDAVIAFVAWDKNNLPVKIINSDDYMEEGSYVVSCNYADINLVPGGKYGDSTGYGVDEETPTIKTFKAIVVSYESFDGDTWENPLYDEWLKMYEGQRLS